MASAPVSGRSTSMPWVSSGAVIMKMINSTSITSMYGTTLISCASLRLRRPGACVAATSAAPGLAQAALEDAGQLVRERVEPVLEPVDLVGEEVVGDDGRDRREQAHGGGDQRLGDARRDHGDGGLL